MKTSIRKTLNEMFGYHVNREMRIKILQESKDTGKSIEEIADQYMLPEIFILDDDGTFEYNGEQMNEEQFKTIFPHRRYTTIATQEQKDNFKKKEYGKNTNIGQ